MLDFKQELKKFGKSLDVTEIEDALASSDVTDMNDLMFKIFTEAEDSKNR